MRHCDTRFLLAIATAAFLAVSGCTGDTNKGTGKPVSKAPAHEEHPEDGPHNGQLIELGEEEYHAELLHDDANHTVTIYVLDSKGKSAVPIEAKQLVLNLVVGGKPQQFKLPAKPLPTDPAGKCSCFATTEEAVCEALDDKATTGRLNIDIQGKAYVGKVEHHDHEEHKK